MKGDFMMRSLSELNGTVFEKIWKYLLMTNLPSPCFIKEGKRTYSFRLRILRGRIVSL